MRLIDADELKYKNLAEVNGKLTYVLTAEEIDNAPTVERPQGEWVPNYTSQFMNPGRQCSLCGKVVEFSENYCPNCGAEMKK
jgi:hypothetical protein